MPFNDTLQLAFMLHGSHHPGVAGSELTRLLARLAEAPPADSRSAFAERLGQWLGWADAIALSTALSTAPAVSATEPSPGPGGDEADLHRVRAALSASITAGPREPSSSPIDFGPFRRHCAVQQQAMQDGVSALRSRIRATLARRSPAMARLAAIDAALDQALASHERVLLGLVPLRLQAHFERMRHAAGDDTRWVDGFRADMDHVLHAELTHRLLPASGLVDTLRTLSTT